MPFVIRKGGQAMRYEEEEGLEEADPEQEQGPEPQSALSMLAM